MRGPASPHLMAPQQFQTELLRAIANAASLPHQRWDLRDRRCPGRLGRNRKEPRLPSATGDPHTTVCRQVRRLRLARAGGGPRLPPPGDSPAPHSRVRACSTAVTAEPMSHRQRAQPASTPEFEELSGEGAGGAFAGDGSAHFRARRTVPCPRGPNVAGSRRSFPP